MAVENRGKNVLLTENKPSCTQNSWDALNCGTNPTPQEEDRKLALLRQGRAVVTRHLSSGLCKSHEIHKHICLKQLPDLRMVPSCEGSGVS